MALRTRVWGAGKLAPPGRRAPCHLRPLRGGVDAPGAARARGAGARSDQSDGQRCDRDAGARGTQSSSWTTARRARSEDRGRARRRAGARRRRDAAQPAQRQSVAERRSTCDATVPSVTGETERSAEHAAVAGRPGAGRRVRDPIRRSTRPMSSSRRIPSRRRPPSASRCSSTVRRLARATSCPI